jgi:hypothetical protein
VPSFDIWGDNSKVAPAGPKVASLMVNLKCELRNAANSDEPLTKYYDERQSDGSPKMDDRIVNDPDRAYNLKNILSEIEYVADAQLTLDVTGGAGFTPGITFTKPYHGAVGLLPATGAALSVGGQLSDSAHRNVTMDLSIDFARLIASPPPPGVPDQDPPLARELNSCMTPASGTDLGGYLGLKEVMATALTSLTMHDIGIFPQDKLQKTSSGPVTDQAKVAGAGAPAAGGAKATVAGIPPTNDPNSKGQYTFGMFTTQIDFTVTENINGGPTWVLSYFKGPGGGTNGLVNAGRVVKDTLLITFVPVCIRQKYPVQFQTGVRYEYNIPATKHAPKRDVMVVGTPGWANYLPPCYDSSPGTATHHQNAQTAAAAAARTANYIRQISPVPAAQ